MSASELDRLDSTRTPEVGRRIKLVLIEGEGGECIASRVTFRGYSGYSGGLSLMATGVDAERIPKLLKSWPEAHRWIARAVPIIPGACVALVQVTWHEHKLCDDLRTRRVAHSDWFCVADPSEVVANHFDDASHQFFGGPSEPRGTMYWSDGTIERVNHVSERDMATIEVHRLLGVLYVMQRIAKFAEADGDHAIGERVVRFLVPPMYLLRSMTSDAFYAALLAPSVPRRS